MEQSKYFICSLCESTRFHLERQPFGHLSCACCKTGYLFMPYVYGVIAGAVFDEGIVGSFRLEKSWLLDLIATGNS